ncbi:MAG: PD-(D/E)XK nuclease family protein [Syntrophorhabdaceae bacterium]|nr:PD-(D/E)XK nuclease family protein [Syntrophorhabdaceae bacterium]
MTIEELRIESHLSVSAINDYIDCGLLYKISRIDKKESEFISEGLAFGSVIHEVIAIYQNHRKEGTCFTKEDMLNSFEYYWNTKARSNESIRFVKGDFHLLMLEGKKLLSLYFDFMMENTFRVIGVETPFRFKVEGVDWPIIGIIDLIEEDEMGNIIISDIKTGKQSFDSDRIDKNLQLTLYQMALKANGYHNRDILLKLDTLIKTKQPKFEPFYTLRTQEDEKRAIIKIRSIWNGIKNSIFIPNDTSWKCKECPYKTYCNEWFKNGG